jgi:hypothetical protein
VLIKVNTIHHEEAKYAKDEIQATLVMVKTKGQAEYCPPPRKYNLKKTDYLYFLSGIGERFMVGGDYNAKNTLWVSRLTTHKGKELYDAIHEYGCIIQRVNQCTGQQTKRKYQIC